MNINSLKAVIKKELNAYFNHPLAYILLCLFIGVSYFFFFKGLFLSKEATVRPYFEVLIWFLLFLVPAITMRSIAAERKDGTLEIMLAQPLTEFEFLLGKFIADFVIVFFAILFSLTIPLTLMLGGKLDFGVVAAQYIGSFFLVGSVVSIGLWASSITKNQTIALLGGIFSIFGLTIIGLDIVVLGMPYPLNNIFQELSLLTHFQNITRGVIDLRDVFYFISVMVIFNAFTYLSFMSRKLNHSTKNFRNLQTGIILITVISVVVNLFGNYINLRLDFTAEKLYSLSSGTRQVLSELNDPLTIKFFVSRDLPAQHTGRYRDLRDTLEDYKSTSGGKLRLEYKFIDDQESKDEAQTEGIQPVQFNTYEEDEYQAKEGYMGLVLNYKDKPKEVIPFVQQTEDFEYQLTSLIRKMALENKRKVAFTTGHGEKDINQDFGGFNQELSNQYNVESIEKKKLTAASLKEVDVLIIAGPKEAFSKKEQSAIKDYIDNGGKVLALIESAEINPQMMAQPVKKNFADFFKQYGVTVNNDMVYDLKANQQVSLGAEQGMQYVLPYPMWVVAQPSSKDSIVTSRLKSVTLPWASSISVDKTKTKYSSLLTTTPNAGSMKGNFNISPTKNSSISDQGLKQHDLAVSLKDMPNGGRIIIIGDADFLSNRFIRQSQEGLVFGLNAVDYLSQDKILIGIRSKNAEPSKLLFKSDAAKNFVRYFNNIFVVLVIALFGFYRLYKRRKKTTEVYA